ncbi:hypothetical protein KY339_05900 [Candidatus Woesearchaeota archaeon]|nr:hypothetical protein [Candidatus Woesearchaeota archaeon]
MVKTKKSQAAMEFLMTYGWAILVVLAAIAALAYFGVLSPGKFIPEKCMLSPGIACEDFKVTSNSVIVILRNGGGKDLIIDSIEVENYCNDTFSTDFNDGQLETFTITGCSNGQIGDRFKGDLNVYYTDKMSNLSKTNSGSISTKIAE